MHAPMRGITHPPGARGMTVPIPEDVVELGRASIAVFKKPDVQVRRHSAITVTDAIRNAIIQPLEELANYLRIEMED